MKGVMIQAKPFLPLFLQPRKAKTGRAANLSDLSKPFTSAGFLSAANNSQMPRRA